MSGHFLYYSVRMNNENFKRIEVWKCDETFPIGNPKILKLVPLRKTDNFQPLPITLECFYHYYF